MRNIWRLFVNDVKRATSNTVTLIIMLGLVLLPSIFSWYNVLACWDVFDNTDNLTVAVANTDTGYESDLVPIEVNLGERVLAELRANDDFNWVFTDEEDAIDGAMSGKYYAAVVIPESFSQDMMTFYSDDVEHAKIVYYTNEKKNVVAPKLTEQGASRVSAQVNEAFAEALSNVGLSVAASLADYADSGDLGGRISDLAQHVDSVSTQMTQAAQMLRSYAGVLSASESVIEGSSELLAQSKESAQEVASAAAEGKEAVSSMSDAVSASADALGEALESTAAGYEGVSEAVDQAFADSDTLAQDTTATLRSEANSMQTTIDANKKLLESLQSLRDSGTLSSDYDETLDALISRMESSIALQESLQKSMREAADDIESGNADAQSTHAEVKELAEQAKQSVQDLSTDYNNDIKPQLETLMEQVGSLSEQLSVTAQTLADAGSDLAGSADSVNGQIETARLRLLATADDLDSASSKLLELSAQISQAVSAGDSEALRDVLSSDTSVLAAALAAPVELDRHAVFPAENFGSQMAPLYTTLGLWIGSLLLVVAIKTSVSRTQRAELGDWKLHQLFLGRFGIFSAMSTLQSLTMALGNMFFVGVQTVHPLLYLLCFWLAGQVFVFIIYTLVVSFANLGKAIAVFLLIIQVTSGGGSFPLQILPDFFQWLSPFLPATHVINAMRAAMMGIYQMDFWVEMGCLLLFVVPFLLLGLALRKPLMRFLSWYVDKVEESKLVC